MTLIRRMASQEPPESKSGSPNPKEGRKKEPPETLEEILNDYLQLRG